MSKPGLYREASHSGSWYSASGNCQYSSVGVSMLDASCVIFLCFYFVFWLSLSYIDAFSRLTLCSLRILKHYPIKTVTCCKKQTDTTRALTLTLIELKSLLLCLTFICCWQPIHFGLRWSQAYCAVPSHTVNVNDWKQEQSLPFLQSFMKSAFANLANMAELPGLSAFLLAKTLSPGMTVISISKSTGLFLPWILTWMS